MSTDKTPDATPDDRRPRLVSLMEAGRERRAAFIRRFPEAALIADDVTVPVDPPDREPPAVTD